MNGMKRAPLTDMILPFALCTAPRKRRDITEVYYRKSMKHSRAMQWMNIFSLSFVLLLHISWSEQKQISLSFSFSRLILRHPSAVLIPISAARRSSSAEKHRRLDFNAARALSFNFSRSRLLFPRCFKSSRSTDLQHLPSQSSSVCSVKSNEAWQSEMKERELAPFDNWMTSTISVDTRFFHWFHGDFASPTLQERASRRTVVDQVRENN